MMELARMNKNVEFVTTFLPFGARLGAIAVLRKGAKLVRPLVVVTAVGMALRLIYEEYL